jgi:hypothetical protein
MRITLCLTKDFHVRQSLRYLHVACLKPATKFQVAASCNRVSSDKQISKKYCFREQSASLLASDMNNFLVYHTCSKRKFTPTRKATEQLT